MATPAIRVFHRLEGLFSVYKPPGVHWRVVRDTIETKLLTDINAAPRQPCPPLIRLLKEPSNDGEKRVTLTATSVPALSHHHLVTGPEFQHIGVGVGHRLDLASSGVLVLSVGKANRILPEFYSPPVTRDYTLEGVFGTATDDFSDVGRVVERSTYDHVTLDKLNSVLAMLQGANQKALLTYSKVDLRSQEAYELAALGLLGPEGKSAPILTGLRCIDFQPPNFTLEVQCINETQKYLRRVVHEIGLELRSTAACTGVRRTRDGAFTLRHALVRQRWTGSDVRSAIQEYRALEKKSKRNQSPMKKNDFRSVEEKRETVSQRHGSSEITVAAGGE